MSEIKNGLVSKLLTKDTIRLSEIHDNRQLLQLKTVQEEMKKNKKTVKHPSLTMTSMINEKGTYNRKQFKKLIRLKK